MKAIAKTLTPLLERAKYLLLTALLLLLALTFGAMLLRHFGMDTDLAGELKKGAVPFFLTASASMFFVERFRKRKEE